MSDYGFNIGNVFGGTKSKKKGRKSKKASNEMFGINGMNNDFLSYIDSGGKSGNMGFENFLHPGNEKINKDRRDDFLSYIPDLGTGYEKQESHGIEGFGRDVGSFEHSIEKSNMYAVKSYQKHKEKQIKEREEKRKKKFIGPILTKTQEKEAHEEDVKYQKEEGKKEFTSRSISLGEGEGHEIDARDKWEDLR